MGARTRASGGASRRLAALGLLLLSAPRQLLAQNGEDHSDHDHAGHDHAGHAHAGESGALRRAPPTDGDAGGAVGLPPCVAFPARRQMPISGRRIRVVVHTWGHVARPIACARRVRARCAAASCTHELVGLETSGSFLAGTPGAQVLRGKLDPRTSRSAQNSGLGRGLAWGMRTRADA